MKTALLAGIGALLTLTPAICRASDIVPEHGMPFCTQRDELQEYVLAAIQHDEEWLKRLVNCGVLKGGVKIGIIEIYPSDSELGHVEKVRMFIPNSTASAVGYVMRMTFEKPAPK